MTLHYGEPFRNCFHFNPPGCGEVNTEREMSSLAKKYRWYDCMWGVVNGGNAMCAGVFRTKREAQKFKKEKAGAYSVVRVIVTPLYTQSNATPPS